MKPPLVFTDIVPCQKTNAANYDQQHDRDIDCRTAGIAGKGWIEITFCSKNVKSGVAECGYGMKHCHPDAAPSIVMAKHRQHGQCAQQFDQKRSSQDEPCQTDDSADLWRRNCILHGAALHQGDFSPGQQRKRCCYGYDAKSSDLDQYQNDHLSEAGPIASGILNNKSCDADGRGRGKQRFIEWRYTSGYCGDRKHQQQRSEQNDPGKP